MLSLLVIPAAGVCGPAASAEREAQEDPASVAERFREYGNGTVLDTVTGLVWLKDANFFGTRLPWQYARQYVDDMNAGTRHNFGYTDWRLPEIDELASLFDRTRFYPALPQDHPFLNVQTRHYYWSSSGRFRTVPFVWLADMASGRVNLDYVSYCNLHYLWPVRSTGGFDRSRLVRADQDVTPSDLSVSFRELMCQGETGSPPPPPPVGVASMAVSPSEIVLSWTPSEETLGVAWYNIYDGSSFLRSVAEPFAYFTSLEPGATRCFSVTAYSDLGLESEQSGQVCATTWLEPAQGTVWSSGLNTYGQLGDGTMDEKAGLVRVAGLADVVRLAVGVEHAAAVRADGTVWAWGRNQRGQLGTGSTRDSALPMQVPGITDAVDAACGLYHTLVLGADGTVWAWGRNYYGQLGTGNTVDSTTPVRVKGLAEVKKIATGWYHSLAVREDGSLWAWGWNHKGQLGYGDTETRSVPVQTAGVGRVTDVDGGLYHTVALTEGGTAWAWGWNAYGQLGSGSTIDSPLPVRITTLDDVRDVAAGMHYSMAVTGDGMVWAWGRNDYGQLGEYSSSQSDAPVLVQGLEDCTGVAAGGHHAAAVTGDGSVWVWGWDFAGRDERAMPRRLSGMRGIQQVEAGTHLTVVLKP